MDIKKKFFAGGALIAVGIALLVFGLIGTFGGPSKTDVAAVANASASDVTALDSRLTGLETAVAGLPTSADVSALSAEISALRQDLANMPDYSTDLSALDARIAALETRIAALETAAAATPTPDPAAKTRTELDPCPGYEAMSFNGAQNPNNVVLSNNPQGFMNVKCFLVVPPANIEVDDVEAWYATITEIEFTVVGGLPRSAFLGDGNGNVALILDTWSYVNATTELPVITVDVTVPEAAALYMTLGEVLTAYHPIGAGHNGYYVYVAYVVDVQALNADKALAWIHLLATP